MIPAPVPVVIVFDVIAPFAVIVILPVEEPAFTSLAVTVPKDTSFEPVIFKSAPVPAALSFVNTVAAVAVNLPTVASRFTVVIFVAAVNVPVSIVIAAPETFVSSPTTKLTVDLHFLPATEKAVAISVANSIFALFATVKVFEAALCATIILSVATFEGHYHLKL